MLILKNMYRNVTIAQYRQIKSLLATKILKIIQILTTLPWRKIQAYPSDRIFILYWHESRTQCLKYLFYYKLNDITKSER